MRTAISALFIFTIVAGCSSKSSPSPTDDESDSGGSSGETSSSGSSSGSSSSGSSSGSSSSGSGSGSGSTAPDDVLCGTNCNLNRSQTCCISPLAQFTCASSPSACPSETAHFSCQQETDCNTGSVCCGTASESNAMAGASCQTTCTTTNTSSTGQAQFCQTDAECSGQAASANRTCIAQSCVIGTPPASVTANFHICGLQSGGSFNCTKM